MSERLAARGLMAIAAREVSERAALLGLAAMLAVVPFVAPWIGIGDRPLLGGFLGTVMVFTAAMLTGTSVIARDLAAIEGIADRVGVLCDGRLVLDEPLEAMKERFALPLERIFAEVTGASAGGTR